MGVPPVLIYFRLGVSTINHPCSFWDPQPFSNTPKRKRNVQPPNEIIERRPNLWKSLEDHLTVGFHVKNIGEASWFFSTKETKKGYMFFFSVSVMLSLPGPNPVLAQPSQSSEIPSEPWDANWVPDDFPSSSMISPSWRFSMIATELMLGWAVCCNKQGDLTEIKTPTASLDEHTKPKHTLW